MPTWLIVPVKPFLEGKSRLAGRMAAADRAALSRALFTGLLDTVRAAQLFDAVVVVSRDDQALAIAAGYGAIPLREQTPGLNEALEQARTTLPDHVDAVAVLPADLPSVSASEIRTLVSLDDGEPGLIIVPSAAGGTNALLVRPPRAIPFAYGANSFDRHCRMARERGLPVRIWHSTALSFDIDLPEDLSHPVLSGFDL